MLVLGIGLAVPQLDGGAVGAGVVGGDADALAAGPVMVPWGPFGTSVSPL